MEWIFIPLPGSRDSLLRIVAEPSVLWSYLLYDKENTTPKLFQLTNEIDNTMTLTNQSRASLRIFANVIESGQISVSSLNAFWNLLS
mgnify:FL=1